MASTSTSDPRKMDRATPYNVKISSHSTPGFINVGNLQQEAADKVSELLNINHQKYHTLYNDVGLHNHIVHHLLTIFSLGASPAEIEAAYLLNTGYQLPRDHHGSADSSSSVPLDMRNRENFAACLGKPERYAEYLKLFQEEIEDKGVNKVVREYLFKGDTASDELLGRLFSGFEHPILNLGFALEYHQPCLTAEALASACIHDTWPLPIVLPTETFIKDNPSTPSTSLLSVVHKLRAQPAFHAAVSKSHNPDRMVPLMAKAGHLLPPILSQWRVEATDEDIKDKMREMVVMCAYMVGAAQRPGKEVGIEFFMMHSLNLSLFFPVFFDELGLTLEQKARVLMWKGWMDCAFYAANGCPELFPGRISSYLPKQAGGWDGIVKRANKYPDDGHTCKLIRALLHASTLAGVGSLPLQPKDFLQIAHMAMDSVERMLEPGYSMLKAYVKLYKEALGMDDEVVKITARFPRWVGVESSWADWPDLEVGKGKARL